MFEIIHVNHDDRVIKVVTSEDAGAIKVEAEALGAEERERCAAIDKVRPGVDLEELLETRDPGVSCPIPGCLVSFVGVERVLDAPFRVIDDSTLSGDADLEWLKGRVNEQAQEVMRLYAHLGLDFVNSLAQELLDDPSNSISRRFIALSPRIVLAPNWYILVVCYHLTLYVCTYKILRDCKFRSSMSLVGVR